MNDFVKLDTIKAEYSEPYPGGSDAPLICCYYLKKNGFDYHIRNYGDGEQEIINETTGEITTNYLSDEEYINIFYPRNRYRIIWSNDRKSLKIKPKRFYI